MAQVDSVPQVPPLRPIQKHRTDIVAGVVVGIIALPLSIALAVAVGAAPITGLYTAVFAGSVATLAGGSRYNITGPTAALVPLLNQVVLQHGAGALPLVGLMAGILLIAMSRLKFGRLIRFMPGPVIIGFTAGIALSIAFGQVNNLLAVQGTDPHLEHFHERLWDTIAHLDTVSLITPCLGIAAVAVMFAWARTPGLNRVPAALVVVVLITSLAWTLDLDTPTLASRYGELPSGLPAPSLAFVDASLILSLVPAACSVAILAGIESLLSAVVADGMASPIERHDPDRELFGQGLANLVSPIMGGMPATAAIARTAAGISNGASSRVTGVVHSLTVLVATVALGSLAGHIPMTVLAAILIVVAWSIADVPEFMGLLRRAPRKDVIILVATVLVTVFLDLTYAISLGVAASAVLLLHQLTAQPAAQPLEPDDSGEIQQVSKPLSDLIQSRPDIAFFTVQGILSFHSVASFEYALTTDISKPLILRMKDVHHIDTSGLLTLESVIEHRHKHGARIVLTAVQPEIYPVLERFGIIGKLGPDNFYAQTRDAIYALESPAPTG